MQTSKLPAAVTKSDTFRNMVDVTADTTALVYRTTRDATVYTYDSVKYTYNHIVSKPPSDPDILPEDHHTKLALGMTIVPVALTVDAMFFGTLSSSLVVKGMCIGAGKKIGEDFLKANSDSKRDE